MTTANFIFKIEFSQTDSEMVIVQATSKERAEAWLYARYPSVMRIAGFYGSSAKVYTAN